MSLRKQLSDILPALLPHNPVDAIKGTELIRLTRTHPAIEMGCSPRAGLSIVQAARARAFVNQRDYVVPEDLFELAEDVVLHRIRLSYEALADGRKPEQVLEELLHQLG